MIDSSMEKNSSSWPSRETQELDLREEQVEEEADMAGGDSEGGGAGLRAALLHPRPRGKIGPVSKIDPILPSPSPQHPTYPLPRCNAKIYHHLFQEGN